MYVGYSTVPGSSEPYNFWSDTSGKSFIKSCSDQISSSSQMGIKKKKKRKKWFPNKQQFFSKSNQCTAAGRWQLVVLLWKE